MSLINRPIIGYMVLGVFIGIASVLFKGTLVMFGIITLIGFVLWTFLPQKDRKFLIALFISGITLRILIFFIFYIVSILQGGAGEITPDSRLYFIKALGMIKSIEGQSQFSEQVEAGVGNNAFIYILAFFYRLIGYDSVVINPVSLFSDKLINCLIGTFTGIPIFYIAKEIFGKKVAKISSFFVVFFPSLFFWSMTNIREPINILLICLLLFSMIRVQKNKKPGYFILFFTSLLLLSTIRLYIFFSALAVSAVFFFTILRKNFVMKTVMIIFLAFFAFFYLPRHSIIKSIYTANHNIISQGGSTYKIYDDALSVGGNVGMLKFAAGLIKGLLFFMLVPFPNQLFTKSQVFFYPQIIIWYLLLCFAFFGIVFALRHRFKSSFVVLLYLFLVTVLYASLEGNVGSAMRHRDLVSPFYLIFSSAGIVHLFMGGVSLDEKE